MGKKEAKPRGRMSAYAFFVQTCREEHRKKHPNETPVFAEFSKKCAERWKTMSDKEKKRFHDMAEKDKKRYEQEMANYTPPPDAGKAKKRKRIKDPNQPKRPMTAFLWFCQEERPKVKELGLDMSVGDTSKELSKRWSVVTDEQKARYEAMHMKDKVRYEKEMESYKKKQAGGSQSPTKKRGGATQSKPVAKEEDEMSEDEDEPEEEDEEDSDDDDE